MTDNNDFFDYPNNSKLPFPVEQGELPDRVSTCGSSVLVLKCPVDRMPDTACITKVVIPERLPLLSHCESRPRHRRFAWVRPPRPSWDPTLREMVCAESEGGGGQKR
ncbi:uncharacterized protein [Physcomitrium patens]|uniref:uncharacterized protein isoform X1 n=1 Tax=Physcomitrium patens TaxID=3218 RepID=UPI000D16EE02|nr:uncharacterized protein LOC112284020 isoform X1 [Physcomitrium patens]|eukprot:XP_024379247.1 uncharacterized protein LOC112284020 isoform X1 [Physcomitrella patens]